MINRRYLEHIPRELSSRVAVYDEPMVGDIYADLSALAVYPWFSLSQVVALT